MKKRLLFSTLIAAGILLSLNGYSQTSTPAAEHPLKKIASIQTDAEIALSDISKLMKQSQTDGNISRAKLNSSIESMFQAFDTAINAEESKDEAARSSSLIQTLDREKEALFAEWQGDEELANKIETKANEIEARIISFQEIFNFCNEILNRLKTSELNIETITPIYKLINEQIPQLSEQYKQARNDDQAIIRKWISKSEEIKARLVK